MAKRRRYVARNKGKTVLRLLLLLMLPVLFAALIFGVVKLLRGEKNAAMEPLPFGAADSYAYTGKGFLYYKDGQLVYEDESERKNNYSLSVSSASSALRLAAGGGLAALYNDSSVLLPGAEAPLSFTGTVERVVCGGAHIAVYLQQDSGDTIEIYSVDGAKRDTLTFPQSTLVNYGIDAQSEDTLWTLTLSTGGGAPISTITTYNLNQGVTNGLLSVHGELVESLYFTADSLFLCGTQHIIRYVRSGNSEAYRELIYGYACEDFSSASGPLFLLRSRAGDGFDNLRLYSLQEAELAAANISNVQLPENSLSAALFGDRLGVFTPDTLYLYDSEGLLRATLPFEESIESAQKLSDSKALVSAGDALYALEIKG